MWTTFSLNDPFDWVNTSTWFFCYCWMLGAREIFINLMLSSLKKHKSINDPTLEEWQIPKSSKRLPLSLSGLINTTETAIYLPLNRAAETKSSVVQALRRTRSIRETTNVVQSQGLTRSLAQADGVASRTLREARTTASFEQSKASTILMSLSHMSIAAGVLSTSLSRGRTSTVMLSQTPGIEQSLSQTTKLGLLSLAHRSISSTSTSLLMRQSVSHLVQSNQRSLTTRATAVRKICKTVTVCS